MNTTDLNEKQLLADIDKLREQFSHTQELYREVCVLMFFRYGMTPTANKLYQYVRKGSMSAPAEALARFWEDLREKSRVRIEHPDLPESLRTAAGELTATLWSAAQAAAQEGLATFRSEAQAQVAEAKQAQSAAEADRDALRTSHELASQTLERAHARISELEQSYAASKATITGLEAQLQHARSEHAGLLQKIEDARRDFAAELEKLRAAAALAEERLRSAEMRALREIDRERTATAKLQKELEASRTTLDQASDRHRVEVAALREQIGDYRQKTGELEGNLKALAASRDLAVDELKATRDQLAERSLQLSMRDTELATLYQQLDESKKTIETLRQPEKPARATRKTKKA